MGGSLALLLHLLSRWSRSFTEPLQWQPSLALISGRGMDPVWGAHGHSSHGIRMSAPYTITECECVCACTHRHTSQPEVGEDPSRPLLAPHSTVGAAQAVSWSWLPVGPDQDGSSGSLCRSCPLVPATGLSAATTSWQETTPLSVGWAASSWVGL